LHVSVKEYNWFDVSEEEESTKPGINGSPRVKRVDRFIASLCENNDGFRLRRGFTVQCTHTHSHTHTHTHIEVVRREHYRGVKLICHRCAVTDTRNGSFFRPRCVPFYSPAGTNIRSQAYCCRYYLRFVDPSAQTKALIRHHTQTWGQPRGRGADRSGPQSNAIGWRWGVTTPVPQKDLFSLNVVSRAEGLGEQKVGHLFFPSVA